MSVSNRNGRVLELVIVEKIQERYGDKVILSENTIKDNLRDNEKIGEMKPDLLKHFKESSIKIVDWLENEIFDFPLYVDRLTDGSGTKGDVTDIRLRFGEDTLNLSIKNNHTALKHQRPPSTPQQFNFEKKSKEDKTYRTEYSSIVNDFLEKSIESIPNIILFSEVSDTIPDLLYEPVCKLVSTFINNYGSDEERANYYFRFLVGTRIYKKVVVYSDKILIQSYDEIPNSKKVTSFVTNKSYISVDFHNGIKLKMRLHTASSRIHTKSLKFDTQPEVFDVPYIEI